MAAEKVLLERHDDGVRVLTLNDPERRNALGPELREQLAAQVERLVADPDARAVVVAGAGPAFCAGADLPAVFADSDRLPVDAMRERLKLYYAGFLRLRDLPFPSIAAVHGPTIGAGLNLALACDVRIAGPDARFAAPFVRLGLHPGGGCSYFLVRTLGPQRALRLLLEGGSVGADEAVALGIAESCHDDPLEAALALAQETASRDPRLVRDMKRAVQLADRQGFDAALEFESWAQAATAGKPAIRDAVARLTRD